jgi:hypothetical protein
MEWWEQLTPPHLKKFQVQNSAGRVLSSIFWDQDSILLIIFQRAKLSM